MNNLCHKACKDTAGTRPMSDQLSDIRAVERLTATTSALTSSIQSSLHSIFSTHCTRGKLKLNNTSTMWKIIIWLDLPILCWGQKKKEERCWKGITKYRAPRTLGKCRRAPEKCWLPDFIHLTHSNFKVTFNYFQTEF